MTARALRHADLNFHEPTARINEARQATHDNADMRSAIAHISRYPHKQSAATVTRNNSDAFSANYTNETFRQARRDDFHSQNRADAAKLLRA